MLFNTLFNYIFKVIKLLYNILKISNYWFATYYIFNKKKLIIKKLIYYFYFIYKFKLFDIINIYIKNTLISVKNDFIYKKKLVIKNAKMIIKIKKYLLLYINWNFIDSKLILIQKELYLEN